MQTSRLARGLRIWMFLVFLGTGDYIAPAHAARLALVVGNAAYVDSPLRNPVNDARAMNGKLKKLGFNVTIVENLKRKDIGRTINGFANRIRPGDEVVVFYAGHGLQIKGVNYLPAVDADFYTEEDVALNSINLSVLLDRLEDAKAGVKILFLDACRNNPYARGFRNSARGLARVQDAASGTLIHFATRPGSVASDGGGNNGLYTVELLKQIDQPGVAIEQVLKRVALGVEKESKGQQEPWVEGSLKGDFYFNGIIEGKRVQEVVLPQAQANIGIQLDAEQEAWEMAKRAHSQSAYVMYIESYPKGKYSGAARVALAGLAPSSLTKNAPNEAAQNGTHGSLMETSRLSATQAREEQRPAKAPGNLIGTACSEFKFEVAYSDGTKDCIDRYSLMDKIPNLYTSTMRALIPSSGNYYIYATNLTSTCSVEVFGYGESFLTGSTVGSLGPIQSDALNNCLISANNIGCECHLIVGAGVINIAKEDFQRRYGAK